MQPGRAGAFPFRGLLRPLLGALLLLLGWGSTTPVRAMSGTISSAVTGPITVDPGETLTLVDGGSVTLPDGTLDSGVIVNGGTLNVTGGSISGVWGISTYGGTVNISGGTVDAIYIYGVSMVGGTLNVTGGSVSGPAAGVAVGNGGSATISGGSVSGGTEGVYLDLDGTATISGGSVSGFAAGMDVESGTVTISGGSLTSRGNGVYNASGTATISGCNLAVANGVLTGILLDGTPINTGVYGAITLDTTSLSITTCPPAQSASADSSCQAAVPDFTAGVVASDRCSAVTITQTPTAGTLVGLGAHTITLTATDAALNSATCTTSFTVVDTTAPTIACPGNMTVNATSASGALVGFTVGASDNCGSVSTECKVGSTVITSPYTFPLGPTTVNCTATDAAGNTTTCTFTVTVVPVADLSVAASASPSPVVTGNSLTYTLVVTNNGPQSAQGVVLTDPLPAGSSFASATRSSNIGTLTTPKGNSSTVSWNVGTLDGGQSVTLTLVVKVSAKAGATLTNTASVTSSSPPDPDPGNNKASMMTTVTAKR
jgi:uncharacterized repeat protein (TIGR01451 family)